jgi:predicted metal-dependent enzyme (double-stranded beta helix superfamily)
LSEIAPDRLGPLRHFVFELTALVERMSDERALLRYGAKLLSALIEAEDWLPASHAAPDPERYSQYLLYADPAARFSVVSFVWAAGQSTPVHDHRVWGLVGVLDGAEIAERFALEGGVLTSLGSERLEPGAIDLVSPSIGDLHRVSNAYDDRTSISIHVYGANIGAVERATYDGQGRAKPFVSGYSPAPALAL